MNPDARRVYAYRPSWKTLVLAILFFSTGAGGLAYAASVNTKGLRFLRLIEMSPAGATRFYVIGGGIFGVLALVAVFGVWRRLARPQRITLDDEGLEVPKSFLSREGVLVPFSHIISVSVTEVTGDRFLKIGVRDGRRHSITQSLLPSRQAFDEIHEAVRTKSPLVPPLDTL